MAEESGETALHTGQPTTRSTRSSQAAQTRALNQKTRERDELEEAEHVLGAHLVARGL